MFSLTSPPKDLSKRKKFYKDADFIMSADARVLRIVSEYLGPLKTFTQTQLSDTLVFFGSARIPNPTQRKSMLKSSPAYQMIHYYDEAEELAHKLTLWSMEQQQNQGRQFIITSGGGPGIMEAACKGAHDAGGKSLGLSISLPFESTVNPYITPELDLEFHYFFMRKFWFLYHAKAVIVFPGGFGTLDELMEILTLMQTKKIKKNIPLILYGELFWKKVINFDYLIETGVISKEDLELITFVNNVDEAFDLLKMTLPHTHSKEPTL